MSEYASLFEDKGGVPARTTRQDIRELVAARVEPNQWFKTDGAHSHYVLKSMGPKLDIVGVTAGGGITFRKKVAENVKKMSGRKCQGFDAPTKSRALLASSILGYHPNRAQPLKATKTTRTSRPVVTATIIATATFSLVASLPFNMTIAVLSCH